MSKVIATTYEQVVTEFAAIIGEKGEDYVYPMPEGSESCVYFAGGQPSCVVGHWFARHNVTGEDLWADNETGVGEFFNQHTSVRIAGHDRRTEKFLLRMQELQDSGLAWGEAYAEAKAYADNPEADPHD